jgi:hypothetical protein
MARSVLASMEKKELAVDLFSGTTDVHDWSTDGTKPKQFRSYTHGISRGRSV